MSSIGAMGINPRLYEKLPYDSVKDFAPVSLIVTVPIVVVVNPEVLPVRDVQQLVKFLKANPGKVNYASAGSGGSSHLVPEYFKFRTGTFMTHIPYQGTGPAVGDLVDHVRHVVDEHALRQERQAAHARGHHGAAPAALSRRADHCRGTRHERFRGVVVVCDVGSGGNSGGHRQAPVRRGCPRAEAADVAKRLTDLGAVPVGSSPQELAAYQGAEQDKWRKVIQRAKIKPD